MKDVPFPWWALTLLLGLVVGSLSGMSYSEYEWHEWAVAHKFAVTYEWNGKVRYHWTAKDPEVALEPTQNEKMYMWMSSSDREKISHQN